MRGIESVEQAIILAAGEGQRLKPFTAWKPKVMIPIANKPILQYVVEALALRGIRDIVIVVGYRKEQVLDFFGSGGQFDVQIQYVVQDQQLGTAHALKQARHLAQDKFLVFSGDNIVDHDAVASLLDSPPNTILAKRLENATKYGVIIANDGVVKEIVEKPKEPAAQLVNTGMYVFTRSIFEFFDQEIEIPSVLQKMIAQGSEIRAQETEGIWLDVVYPWDILKLSNAAMGKLTPGIGGTVENGVTIKPPVSIGKDSIIRGNCYIVGPVIIGENCEIGPGAIILPATTIGDNVCIRSSTEIWNSVIGNGVKIDSGSTVHDSIIDRGCSIGISFIARSGQREIRVDGEYHQVEMGAVIGEHSTIEDLVIVEPGITIGTQTRIKGLKVIGENIPDRSLVI
jgi:UDP-N-acetylglucosamine diphosphorylase/glucosamine-1-phosphate N-acetyltransferase